MSRAHDERTIHTSPAIYEIEAKRLKELVPNLVRTIVAHGRCIVRYISSTSRFKEAMHVCTTILTDGGGEGVVLVGITLNDTTVKFGDDLIYCEQFIYKRVAANDAPFRPQAW